MKRNFAQICTSDEFKASHRWWKLEKKDWKLSSQNDALASVEALWLDNDERKGKSDGRLQSGHRGKFSCSDHNEILLLFFIFWQLVLVILQLVFIFVLLKLVFIFLFCIYYRYLYFAACICICVFAAWPNPLKIASQQWQPRGPGERDPTSKQCGQVHIIPTLFGWTQ